MNVGIVVAAGKSERMGTGVDKAFLSLGARPVVSYALAAFQECQDIEEVVLVVRKDRVSNARNLVRVLGYSKVVSVIAGGSSRQQSVGLGLAECSADAAVVVVHDGARPCTKPTLISDTIKSAKRHGSGVAAFKIGDTVKQVDRGLTVSRTIDRTHLWAVQTPQAFKADLLRRALDAVEEQRAAVTDEASAVELIGESVHLVCSTCANVKITGPEDLAIASALLHL